MVKITSTIHNHTTFCDGMSTPEEMVLSAIDKGMTTIGFSAHSYTPCDDSYCLKDSDGYFEEIFRLRDKYRDKIDVLAGLEVDCYGNDDVRADYVIMSVHNVMTKHGLYVVDYSAAELKRCIKEDFDGDVYALIEAYYDTVLKSLERKRIDVVGHLDLVTKFNEQLPLIDTTHPRYIQAVEKVLQQLDGKKIPLEINTGGVYRGYKSEYYPSKDLLQMIAKYNIPLVITADAHNKQGVDYKFDQVVGLLTELGIQEVWQLKKHGFTTTAICP